MQKRGIIVICLAFLLALPMFSTGCKKTEETPADQTPAVTPETPGGVADTGQPAAPEEDEVWIRVNGQDVMKSAVMADLERMKQQMGGQVPPEQMPAIEPMMKKEAMQRAVQRVILDQMVEKEGIQATEEEIRKELDNIKSQFPDVNAFQQRLDELKITEDDLKKEISQNLRYYNLFDKMIQIPEPSDEAISEVYERTKSRLVEPAKVTGIHILLMVPAGATDEDKQKIRDKADEARKKIMSGEDIAAVVEQYSDAPNKAAGGSETFVAGQMPSSFDDAVFNLEPGQLSEIIETPMGFHIVKVLEKSPESVTPLEDVRDDIVAYLKEQQQKESFTKYMEDLMSKAKIEYIEPEPQVSMPGMTDPHHQGAPGEPGTGEGGSVSEPPMEEGGMMHGSGDMEQPVPAPETPAPEKME